MAAPQIIHKLVDRFEKHLEDYKSGRYNETQLRREFVDPFFAALGWDVANIIGDSENYKAVIHEDRIKIEGATKAPDYCFRAGGRRVFFVEAKKPSINIGKDISPAYQLRRYAWSAQLPISILTDFEEFAIYDCRIKPNKDDGAAIARIDYINFREYIEKWDKIESKLSLRAIQEGSLNEYIKSVKKQRGTVEIDDDFLDEIEAWREELSISITKTSKTINQDELNYAVQKIIDRIIFLRICEDRGIEKYGQLYSLLENGNVYNRLCEIFLASDRKYNSGLFHFNEERNRDGIPDNLTLGLTIDDSCLKKIIKHLYYPYPYEFSVISADILGHVYEQFLGKVIVWDKTKKRPIIEEKPEVRHAGGVYYTPTFIVEHIVENTLGRMLEGKTISEAKKIKVLDPACGSGSFLTKAYQYLLSWFRDEYIKNGPEKYARKKYGKYPILYVDRNGNWQLTTPEKKRILLNNIYGVDVDSKAVEVTKLSLLLKVLEGEHEQIEMFKHHVLPGLEKNILFGNSLVNHDVNDAEYIQSIDKNESQRINPFNWYSGFRDILNSGGFDIVIGNPPYVDSETMVKIFPCTRKYCAYKYVTAKGNWDLYCVFCEKALSLTKEKGYFGFIIPNKFISAPYGDHLKEYFSKFNIIQIVDYSSVTVFVSRGKKINVYPIIILATKKKRKQNALYFKMRENGKYWCSYKKEFNIKPGEIEWAKKFDIDEDILNKVEKKSKKLDSFFNVFGAATVSEAYEIKKLIHEKRKPSNNELIFINTGTIDRYKVNWGMQETTYIKNQYMYPVINSLTLKGKYPNRYKQATSEKIIMAGMVKELESIYDPGRIVAGKSTVIILNKTGTIGLKCLLGLLNSSLYRKIYKIKNKHTQMAGGYINVGVTRVEEIPIYDFDFSKKSDCLAHKKICESVDKLNELNKKISQARTEYKKEEIERKINVEIKHIDNLVNNLFDIKNE